MRHDVQKIIEHFSSSGRELRLTEDGRVYPVPAGLTRQEGDMLSEVQSALVEQLRIPPFRATRTLYAPPEKRGRKPKEQSNADQHGSGENVPHRSES